MGEVVDLSGKDFLTETEAAAYCCVSKSTFCQHARSIGVQARRWMGRKVYSKAELYAAMDVTIYEVVHTSPVTRRKAESIFELDGELSDLGWRLTLSVVDVCGKEMCRVDPWALNWQVFERFMVGKSKDVIPAALAAMQDDGPIRIKARDLPQRQAALTMLI